MTLGYKGPTSLGNSLVTQFPFYAVRVPLWEPAGVFELLVGCRWHRPGEEEQRSKVSA